MGGLVTESSFPSTLPREVPTLPLNSVSPIRSVPGKLPLRQAAPDLSPSHSRLYFPPQIQQSPKALEDTSSRPLPLPNKAGTPATSGTIPIKPLVDKLSKPAAFTKPSATVTPTLKSTGLTASTVRPNVSTTTSTKTVSTCSMVPRTLPPQNNVEKGEASSTTCSPKPDSALSEVTSSLPQIEPHETDSDPNVTSTTGSSESKKKIESSRDIKIIKKELDSLTNFKEKKDLGEELLFAPTATIIQAVKPKYDKKDKKSNSLSKMDVFSTLKDVKRVKDSLQRDKIKINKEKKDKMKVKQKNDLKDFLSATATIRKEAKKDREDKKKEPEKKEEVKKEEKSEHKRRLS